VGSLDPRARRRAAGGVDDREALPASPLAGDRVVVRAERDDRKVRVRERRGDPERAPSFRERVVDALGDDVTRRAKGARAARNREQGRARREA
jgi:hypothetical protein